MMKKRTIHLPVCILIAVTLLTACRHEQVIDSDGLSFDGKKGLFLLCEGNMGSNKATIDFYDMDADTLYRNIYPAQNPHVVKELGDVGNDIAFYGNRLYAVINVSGKVEIMDRNAHRITQVDVPNCRYLAFDGKYCYVSSYAGPVDYGNPEYAQRGYVAKIDTAALAVKSTCPVGYQPNGMAICDGQLYVANSGGYMSPNYDSTLSVIDLERFEETHRIPVAKNLGEVCLDSVHRMLYVTAISTDYISADSLYRVNLQNEQVEATGIAASKMCLADGNLYFYSYHFAKGEHAVGVLNTETGATEWLDLSNSDEIRVPYGIWVDPSTKDIYLTDARDYVTPGVLYRYSQQGVLLSSFRTGDIPGHFAVLSAQ